MSFKEDFLHHIWKYKRFDHSKLKTTDGQHLSIENYGMHNHGSGPDFHHGRIIIGDTKWAGNIEMHIKASDWHLHKHQTDTAYDNVILHVVYEDDKMVYNSKGQVIPTLELKGRIDPKVIASYNEIISNTLWVPCADQIHDVDGIVVRQAIDNAVVQRLRRKSDRVTQSLAYYNKDWNKVFFEFIAIGLGAKINKKPFEHLARIMPLEVLSKVSNEMIKVEALLFGQAGLLDGEPKDTYHKRLQSEYAFLQHKHKLSPMQKASWQFSGLRPASFPHVRIAQFAKLITNNAALFSKVKSLVKKEEIEAIFETSVDGYWSTHYNFNKESKARDKRIGKVVRHNLLINSVVPVMFAYADKMKEEDRKERLFEILQSVEFEKNSVTNRWKELGLKLNSAYDSQGLLELKNECCNFKKCLSCPIGVGLLKE